MSLKNKKRTIVLSALAIILIALTAWVVWANTALVLNTFTISSDRLPKAFDGFKIAQVSDLHNAQIGKDNKKLISTLESAKPDIIAITGDIIDSRNTDTQVTLDFVKKAVEIAPCYYVTGNHESRIEEYESFKTEMENLGVEVLEDEKIKLEQSSSYISLIGVNDPSFTTAYLFGDSVTVMAQKLSALTDEDSYTVLLSHRPELFECYSKAKVDLVLSGHAHGGQVVLPFDIGLVAPNQGFFPKYDFGLFTQESTNMIVSRGIGNSIIPIRINNRPEVILVQLESKQ